MTLRRRWQELLEISGFQW